MIINNLDVCSMNFLMFDLNILIFYYLQGAQRLSAETRKFAHLALGIGIAVLVLAIVVVGLYLGLVLPSMASGWDK